jgi:hypothetical protein
MKTTYLRASAHAIAPIRPGKLVSILFLTLLGWMLSTSCFAYDLYVDSTANPNVADGSIANPYPLIQQAVDHALNNALPENNTPPYPTVQINIYHGDYLENVAINFRTSSFVTDITIRNMINEENCNVIGVNNQLPVIYATGYNTSRLELSGIRISSSNSSINSRGVKIGDWINPDAYFGTFEMNDCFSDYYGTAVEAQLLSLNALKIMRSTFVHRYAYSRGVYSMLNNINSAEAIITNNIFSNSLPSSTSTSVSLQGRSYNTVNISNNDMDRTRIALRNIGNLSAPGTSAIVQNNNLTNSEINVESTSIEVLNNKMLGSSNPNQPVLHLYNWESTVAKAIVSANIFLNCQTAIYLQQAAENQGHYWRVSAFIEGNSFINCPKIVKMQRVTGTSVSNTIKLFRNNLSTSPSQSVFDICDFVGNPITLPEAEKIPISYSHFASQLNPSNSLIIGTNVSYGDPGILLNETGDSYTLLWNEAIRSPAILRGYYDGLMNNNFDERPDIGAVQYAAHPHENRTYTFPAGNDRNGIKWMSFPSLDRIWNPVINEPDMARSFFSTLFSPFILNSVAWKVTNSDPTDFHLDPQVGWIGYDHQIRPQQGYKFQMNPGLLDPVYISTPAIMPDQDLPITLIARTTAKSTIPDNENWIGYFGERTVHPSEAFASILPNLWYIQSQNWTLARLTVSPGSPWIGISYPGSKPPTLKYGDMVIVKCFDDAEFTWNAEAPEREEFIKEKPSAFTFTEKMDYIPVYVEFNGTDIPKEAAVYLEGICKGAAVVGGNSVEIPAYILDDIGYGAELELRVFYDTKAAYNPIPLYQTWNQERGEYDHNAISLSERKPYYMLKMDTGSINDTPAPKLYMGNYPNPFNPDTTLRFSLPENADINLEIYNVKGQKVRSLVNGSYNAGSHTCLWDAKDNTGSRVASGIYFAMLSYKGNQLSRKLLLMK